MLQNPPKGSPYHTRKTIAHSYAYNHLHAEKKNTTRGKVHRPLSHNAEKNDSWDGYHISTTSQTTVNAQLP